MNKFIIVFGLLAVAAVALAADEQGPSPSEYDVYNSNGDSNLEEAARPKRFLLLKKKLLLGKALAVKKGVLVGGAALGGGALLAKKFHGGYAAPSVTHYYAAPAPVYYDHHYDYAHYYDDHHYDHHDYYSSW